MGILSEIGKDLVPYWPVQGSFDKVACNFANSPFTKRVSQIKRRFLDPLLYQVYVRIVAKLE